MKMVWLLVKGTNSLNRDASFTHQIPELYTPSSSKTSKIFPNDWYRRSASRAHIILHAFLVNVFSTSEFSLLLGPGLLAELGSAHRRQRKMLNPVFSVAHLRNMTGIFYTIAHQVTP